MKKIRKNYILEFKIQAVSLSEQRGNISSVAQEGYAKIFNMFSRIR
jgi:transposase